MLETQLLFYQNKSEEGRKTHQADNLHIAFQRDVI